MIVRETKKERERGGKREEQRKREGEYWRKEREQGNKQANTIAKG